MSNEEWVDVHVVGTLSNGISHSVVMLSEHEDFKEICDESVKVYQIYIGRREAEQIEYYMQRLYGELVSEGDVVARPTTIDLINELFTAFSGDTDEGKISVIEARIDDLIDDGIYTAKLILELEGERSYFGAELDVRPSDIIAIALGQKLRGRGASLSISKLVLDAMDDIGDAQQGERSLRDIACELVARPTQSEG